MACWAFAELLQDNYDVPKLIKLALLHDLGEIEAGDTFLYSNNRNNVHVEERKCVEKIASHPGNSIGDIVELWEEQEAGESKEAWYLYCSWDKSGINSFCFSLNRHISIVKNGGCIGGV